MKWISDAREKATNSMQPPWDMNEIFSPDLRQDVDSNQHPNRENTSPSEPSFVFNCWLIRHRAFYRLHSDVVGINHMSVVLCNKVYLSPTDVSFVVFTRLKQKIDWLKVNNFVNPVLLNVDTINRVREREHKVHCTWVRPEEPGDRGPGGSQHKCLTKPREKFAETAVVEA